MRGYQNLWGLHPMEIENGENSKSDKNVFDDLPLTCVRDEEDAQGHCRRNAGGNGQMDEVGRKVRNATR